MAPRFRKTEAVLSALPVFEAAARHLSFTRAAEELSLSQPTVSHHIAHLEEVLELQLFARHHNRIRLTDAGEQLAASVSLGLGHIDQELRALRQRNEPGSLTLACSLGFANGWLMPRFSDLRRALDGYPVHVATTDWHQGYDRDSADLIVTWAGETRSPHDRIALFPEIVTPVCSADYLARHPGLSGDSPAERLLDQSLIHFDPRTSQFMTWQIWFSRHGIDWQPPPDPYRYSNYEFMLQAVAEGEGIGLGWVHLIEDLLESGQLLRLAPDVEGERTAYYLETRHGRVPEAILRRAADWFAAAGAGMQSRPGFRRSASGGLSGR